jgi:hypothetical protein
MPGADTSKGQMPRPRHSHLNCVWERLTAHKATCVNSVYGFTFNWLQVLGPTERSQVDQGIGHQLHPIVPLLNTLKPQEEPLELVFPGKGPFDTHPQRMDGFVEEAFASTLDSLAVARILFDIGDQACVKNALAIACGIKAAIEVEVGSTEIDTHLFGHLFQRFQALRQQDHVWFIDRSYGDRR